MTFSIRLNNDESDIIKAYAKLNGMTVSELFRRSVMEHIENEFDLKAYDEAMEEYEADPVTFGLEDVIKELDLL